MPKKASMLIFLQNTSFVGLVKDQLNLHDIIEESVGENNPDSSSCSIVQKTGPG
jgi:hypothetical protein